MAKAENGKKTRGRPAKAKPPAARESAPPSAKAIEADLLLFAMLDAQEDLHKRVETSGHGTGKMPSEILLAHPITMPPREVQRERVVHISALNDRIAANRAESRTLAHLRDELLPRLLSGEVSVGHAECEAEAVA